ncbi:hypothetical protein FJV41_31285 [Myxococcus llanfairpwllgwyngyllgogerychwyrndrobwllllantysiliogogogochensis]|uniref:Uncharacterized protein n=1 Tax=Myxococcus llanfairpwllgwyngyllgogerychwyrndrobwllllantysiliogogogochensis TaxID=2590453 RepID=A0A540WSM1_9BACT|nr:hypothetical protein [Myxococcus llanfairpwllgwyngyllgogerychwyrndrobwllllantysiliogogogochensis]TQF12012.1 hypothetical protein FJV41_31285 [Myxococcus llanfairpwllgwyngyllgogerychwyrndrobwllllantysiliogogogochensis]
MTLALLCLAIPCLWVFREFLTTGTDEQHPLRFFISAFADFLTFAIWAFIALLLLALAINTAAFAVQTLRARRRRALAWPQDMDRRRVVPLSVTLEQRDHPDRTRE